MTRLIPKPFDVLSPRGFNPLSGVSPMSSLQHAQWGHYPEHRQPHLSLESFDWLIVSSVLLAELGLY